VHIGIERPRWRHMVFGEGGGIGHAQHAPYHSTVSLASLQR
jgi:hypothetical protein